MNEQAKQLLEYKYDKEKFEVGGDEEDRMFQFAPGHYPVVYKMTWEDYTNPKYYENYMNQFQFSEKGEPDASFKPEFSPSLRSSPHSRSAQEKMALYLKTRKPIVMEDCFKEIPPLSAATYPYMVIGEIAGVQINPQLPGYLDITQRRLMAQFDKRQSSLQVCIALAFNTVATGLETGEFLAVVRVETQAEDDTKSSEAFWRTVEPRIYNQMLLQRYIDVGIVPKYLASELYKCAKINGTAAHRPRAVFVNEYAPWSDLDRIAQIIFLKNGFDIEASYRKYQDMCILVNEAFVKDHLRHMAAEGILHGDMKADNVVLTQNCLTRTADSDYVFNLTGVTEVPFRIIDWERLTFFKKSEFAPLRVFTTPEGMNSSSEHFNPFLDVAYFQFFMRWLIFRGYDPVRKPGRFIAEDYRKISRNMYTWFPFLDKTMYHNVLNRLNAQILQWVWSTPNDGYEGRVLSEMGLGEVVNQGEENTKLAFLEVERRILRKLDAEGQLATKSDEAAYVGSSGEEEEEEESMMVQEVVLPMQDEEFYQTFVDWGHWFFPPDNSDDINSPPTSRRRLNEE